MSLDLRDGIVRILKSNGETAGAGFVLDTDGLIATCSHVVQSNESQKRGEPKPEKTTIVFRATGESREAQIEPDWWRSSHKGEDVAILRVNGGLPEGVNSLLLGSSKGTSKHPFDTFGFPKSNQKQGIWGDGHILGETEIQDILVRQLSSTQITPGFSGAPVVDRLRSRVVGMVTSITSPDDYGRQAETAFITPVETLQDICSVLKLSDLCPYRDLEAFTEADATFFRGRERVIEMLVDNLQNEPRFLAVFGASGSGKSSVVQAGLIPRLRKGALPGSDRWDYIVTRPTDAFFKQHLTHLDQASTPVALIIDQFEELFVSYDETASLGVMTQLTHHLEHSPHVTLLILMRDDFYSLLMRQETLAVWLKSRVVNVWSTLKREELESIVRDPAEHMGWQFEGGLVETIVDDVLATSAKGHKKGESSESSTILPLLEFTLTQLWERRQDGILTHEAYRHIGNVTGCLRQWADNAYYTFDERLRPLVRQIFTELVHLGDEEQHIADSRRRRPLSSLIHKDAERTDISQIVQQLTADRLLVTSQDQKSKQETVEIIHDALLWEWGLLRRWVEEDRRYLLWHQELERRVQAWIKTNPQTPSRREKEKLLRGSELLEAMDWLKQHPNSLTPDDQTFIQVSRYLKQRRLFIKVISAALLSGIAISTGGWWVLEQMKPYIDVALYTGHTMPVHTVAWSPEGSRLASGSVDRTVQVYFSHGEKIYTYRGHTGTVSALAWSPDGYRVASASGDKTVQIWTSDGKGVQPPLIYRGHRAVILSLAWSPRGKPIASGSGAPENLVHIWDPSTLALLYRYQGHTQPVNGLAWSPDGTRIASASGDSTVHVWKAATGKLLILYTGHQAPTHVISVAWSPDGQYLASAGYEGAVHIWSAETGKTLNVYQGHGNRPVTHVDWCSDNTYVASASADKTVQIWTALEGKLICTYNEHIKEVECVAWSRPGDKKTAPLNSLIASSSLDKTVHIWKLK